MRVHGDVKRSIGHTEDKGGRDEGGKAGRSLRQQQGQREAQRSKPGRSCGAVPRSDQPGHRHNQDSPRRKGQQSKAERAGRQHEPGLEGRNGCGPGADAQSVGEEDERDRGALCRRGCPGANRRAAHIPAAAALAPCTARPAACSRATAVLGAFASRPSRGIMSIRLRDLRAGSVPNTRPLLARLSASV